MRFFISNTKLDNTIHEIRIKLRTSMNGDVSEQMTKRGVLYKKNYGVDIPRLKQIAAGYEQNHDLAQRLWALSIREAMILATLLEPVEKFTLQNAEKWAEETTQVELAEQLAMNLLSKLKDSNELSFRLIKSESEQKQIIGFLTASRISTKLQIEEVNFIINRAFGICSQSLDRNPVLIIARCIARFCRLGGDAKENISIQLKEINNTHSGSENIALLTEIVQQELDFLYL